MANQAFLATSYCPMNPPSLKQLEKSILIIDDTLDNLRLLSTVLGKEGYQIQCANNGPMALIMVENSLPDLILLDIRMPDMDGYEVCRALKANEQTRHIPVMFLSALDDVVDKVYAFEVGGVDYITKPFDFAEMLIRVRHQLKLQAIHSEIRQLNAELDQRVQQRTTQLSEISHQLAGETAQREQIQKRLEDSEQRLESILNALDDVVWSVSIDTLEILYLNPAVERVYGRTVEEFLAHPKLWLEVIHSTSTGNGA
jgi:DNA-binding response OmpR family regulator